MDRGAASSALREVHARLSRCREKRGCATEFGEANKAKHLGRRPGERKVRRARVADGGALGRRLDERHGPAAGRQSGGVSGETRTTSSDICGHSVKGKRLNEGE